MDRDAPFIWGDRYDLIGLAAAAAVVVALVLLGASVWLVIACAAAALNLTSYALRRRSGVPQVALWQWWRHARR